MPKRTDWQDTKHLKYVLLHEYVHICHYDSLIKLIATAALCIHWFNPLVWVMYILFNRDIELACDENVVHRLGEKSKSTYALMLISMEIKKSKLMPLGNNFNKNAIEERITAIMKTKKTSLLSILVGLMLILVVVTACATTTPDTQDNDNTSPSEESADNVILDNPNEESIQDNSSMANSDVNSETTNNEMSEPTQESNSAAMPNNGDSEEQKEDVTNENAGTETNVANINGEVKNIIDSSAVDIQLIYEITNGNTGKQITLKDSQQLEYIEALLENMTIHKEELIISDAEKPMGYLYWIRIVNENGEVSKNITLNGSYIEIDGKYYNVESTENLVAYLDGLYK